jgi:hypothetical protein
MSKQDSPAELNKELVVRALTDPKFRKQLKKDPAAALGVKKLGDIQAREVRLILAIVKGIDTQIAGLADELLCVGGGGGCGIA